MKYKRILLKLSGESLMGNKQQGIDEQRLEEYAQQIADVVKRGIQVGIVIGGGNIFRGLSGAGRGFDRVKGDQMGMLATVINSLALSSALEKIGVKARVLTAVCMEPIGEFYSKWKAVEALERGDKLFTVNCAQCHGAKGGGDGKVGEVCAPKPPAIGTKYNNASKPDGFFYFRIYSGQGQMPPFGYKLTPEEISSIILHVRKLQNSN